MADVDVPTVSAPPTRINVADRLTKFAAAMPDVTAVACPRRTSPGYRNVRQGDSGTVYATTTFAELDSDATHLASGLLAWGVPPGTRLALFVRPGIEFVTLVFALLRAGMVIVLIDPGLRRRNLIRCLEEAKPEGFVAIPVAQAARLLLRHKFPHARWNVTVGRRWFWSGLTLDHLRALGASEISRDPNGSPEMCHEMPATRWGRGCSALPAIHADFPAAIIFTSGSTGPPKGVLYTHRIFDTQVAEIQSMYSIEPRGIDLACFPLFALFNSAMGVTTILPEMDFSRPATADPRKLLTAANDWQVTQAFASPAVWRVVSEHCAKTGDHLESLRQVFSCGAAVPADVLRNTLACVAPSAKMHTPYGATECLPVATIEAAEVLSETAQRTDEGAGVCVGRKFDSIDWRVIRITDEPIATVDEAEELSPGEIGELIVRGPQASPRYFARTQCNAEAKIMDERAGSSPTPAWAEDGQARNGAPATEETWHRMGDVGYLDDQGRFWYCGRRSQRVETADGPLFTECVEAVINTHPDIARAALVGLGSRGHELPVIFFEPRAESARGEIEVASELYAIGQRFSHTRSVHLFAEFDRIPVDIRHSSKILREELAGWAKEIVLLEIDGLKPPG